MLWPIWSNQRVMGKLSCIQNVSGVYVKVKYGFREEYESVCLLFLRMLGPKETYNSTS